jgi:hypothetical protein
MRAEEDDRVPEFTRADVHDDSTAMSEPLAARL